MESSCGLCLHLSLGEKESLPFCIGRVLNTNHVKVRDNHCNVFALGKIYGEYKIVLEMCYVLLKSTSFLK